MRIDQQCLWRGNVDSPKKSLSICHLVCRPTGNGGTGIIKRQIQNQALLLKYIHKFLKKDDIPCVLLIWNKHYTDTPPHAMPSCGWFWWKDVFSLMDIYRGITKCVLQAGDTVLLWKDDWDSMLVVGIQRVGETRECFVLLTICSVFSDVLINKQN